jgi:hypothetical protein
MIWHYLIGGSIGAVLGFGYSRFMLSCGST